jgi:type VI secretion system protein VasJ
MLGIGKQKTGIEVSAYGKHPAFDDYFSVNMEPPLANALSSWIESGIKSGGTAGNKKEIRSFRFWVLGIKKEELIVGVVRDSSDRLGRIYPLLIIGKTRLKNRDREWPKIFSGFDPVFRAFEAMTAARYTAFNEFENSLLKVQFYEPDFETSDTRLSNGMTVWFKHEKGRPSSMLPVSELMDKFASQHHDPQKKKIIKKNLPPPGAVFLGGLPDNPMVNVYNRPLGTRDFQNLFNLRGCDQAGLNLSNGHQNNMDFNPQ